MIDFELSESVKTMRHMVHAVAEQMMRPIAREYDEREHEKPWDFLNTMWGASRGVSMSGDDAPKDGQPKQKGPSEGTLRAVVTTEELCWGDVGLYLSIPNSGLSVPLSSRYRSDWP